MGALNKDLDEYYQNLSENSHKKKAMTRPKFEWRLECSDTWGAYITEKNFPDGIYRNFV